MYVIGVVTVMGVLDKSCTVGGEKKERVEEENRKM